MGDKTDRKGVLTQIRNPLVFFGLALLVIEGIIGIIVGTSNMDANQKFYSVLLMAVLFLVVVGIVALITIKWPSHLYERITEQLETTEEIKKFINSTAFRDFILDIVESKGDKT